MTTAMLSLTVLSINIWDLPVPPPGVNHRWRRRQLLRQLPELDPDILLIQEAFRPAFKLELRAALAGHYADHFLADRRRCWGIRFDGSGGLLTLSRWPVITSRYIPARTFSGMRADERVAAKGCLLTLIDTPAGRLTVGNVHLYAGLGARSARARALQTRHLLEALPHPARAPLLLGGDFNMGLETERVARGPTGFELLREAAFREAADCANGPLSTVVQSRNRYARYWPGQRPDRRLTYLFYRGTGLRRTDRSVLLCLDAPPVSDHFGFLASFQWGPVSTARSPADRAASAAVTEGT